MNYYCTLFDSNYLTKGLTMYDSLVKTEEDFYVYIFAFDDLAKKILLDLKLEHAKIIGLEEFETEELKKKKIERSRGEYCWTCTSFVIGYVLKNFNVEEITYLDSDLYFFNSPEILLVEFRKSNCDILLTKHRYTPEYNQEDLSGIYCVQFMTFKNNKNAWNALSWWQDRCLEWCFNRREKGKLGDQKYLDDWTKRFSGVHVLENLGGGVAPWNIQQYRCTEGPFIDGFPVVFYHYHLFQWLKLNKVQYGWYKLSEEVIHYIYMPYWNYLKKSLDRIKKVDPKFKKNFFHDKNKIQIYLEKRIQRNLDKKYMAGLMNTVLKDKKCIVFGAGKNAAMIYQWLYDREITIEFFVDNNEEKQEKGFCGKDVLPPNTLLNEVHTSVIFISVDNYHDEIELELEMMGYRKNTNYFYFDKIREVVLKKYVDKNMLWLK